VTTISVAAMVLAACTASPDITDTPPAAAPAPSAGSAAGAGSCSPAATASFAPSALAFPDRSLQKQIRDRGRFVVGVSSDSYLLGSFKPGSVTEFQGFDIDIAREVARAIFGAEYTDRSVQFKVITAADRIPAVNAGAEAGGVDLVARNMTMTCGRWNDVNFSAVYFEAAQKVLVRADARETSMKALGAAKKRICAPKGSTSLANVTRLAPGGVQVEADQHTACLALLQEGRVDAITGDDTVLAGLVAQDPATKVVGGALTSEPYGLAVAKRHPEFARFVNRVLADLPASRWQQSYTRWFITPLGRNPLTRAAPPPPDPQYGRR
jgi:polar amino acid transport system substrate-binding protein